MRRDPLEPLVRGDWRWRAVFVVAFGAAIAVVGSVALELPLPPLLIVCVIGTGLTVVGTRWFDRKTGQSLYRERLRETAAKHAAEKQRNDA